MIQLWMKIKTLLTQIGIGITLILGAFLWGMGKENSRQKHQQKLNKEQAKNDAWQQKYENYKQSHDINNDADLDKRMQQNGWFRDKP